MIIVGYQGIGKTTVANGHVNYIDLESSNFFVNGVRDLEWYKVYCNIAESLSRQGNFVFVSSHEVVRREMRNRNVPKAIIFPSLALKEQWIKRLEERFNACSTIKNYKAWKNAEEKYDENIRDLQRETVFTLVEIESMDYSLPKMVSEIEKIKLANGWRD